MRRNRNAMLEELSSKVNLNNNEINKLKSIINGLKIELSNLKKPPRKFHVGQKILNFVVINNGDLCGEYTYHLINTISGNKIELQEFELEAIQNTTK